MDVYLNVFWSKVTWQLIVLPGNIPSSMKINRLATLGVLSTFECKWQTGPQYINASKIVPKNAPKHCTLHLFHQSPLTFKTCVLTNKITFLQNTFIDKANPMISLEAMKKWFLEQTCQNLNFVKGLCKGLLLWESFWHQILSLRSNEANESLLQDILLI